MKFLLKIRLDGLKSSICLTDVCTVDLFILVFKACCTNQAIIGQRLTVTGFIP